MKTKPTIKDIQDATEQLLKNRIPMPTNADIAEAMLNHMGIPVITDEDQTDKADAGAD